MENIKEYPFNVIEMIFGGHKDVSGDKDKLIEMLDKAFETLKTFPEDEIAEEFKAYELPLSKSVDVAVKGFKTNKTVEELAKEFNLSEELVNSAIAKVLRKFRHPEIAKPIHGLVTFID